MIFMKKEGGAGQEVEGQEVGQVETEEPLGEDEPSTSTSKKPGNTFFQPKLLRRLQILKRNKLWYEFDLRFPFNNNVIRILKFV